MASSPTRGNGWLRSGFAPLAALLAVAALVLAGRGVWQEARRPRPAPEPVVALLARLRAAAESLPDQVTEVGFLTDQPGLRVVDDVGLDALYLAQHALLPRAVAAGVREWTLVHGAPPADPRLHPVRDLGDGWQLLRQAP